LQPSLAFCCAVIGCKLKQNANEGYNSCASLAELVLSFIACFILLVIAPFTVSINNHTTATAENNTTVAAQVVHIVLLSVYLVIAIHNTGFGLSICCKVKMK